MVAVVEEKLGRWEEQSQRKMPGTKQIDQRQRVRTSSPPRMSRSGKEMKVSVSQEQVPLTRQVKDSLAKMPTRCSPRTWRTERVVRKIHIQPRKKSEVSPRVRSPFGSQFAMLSSGWFMNLAELPRLKPSRTSDAFRSNR